MRQDRIAGAATVAIAALIALWTLNFSTTFPTDPLGPRAFPWVAALLIGGSGGWLLVRPRIQPTQHPPLPSTVWLGAASFVAYALLLPKLGFLAATLVEFVVLASVFGGRLRHTILAGALLVGVLHALFVQVLGLPLPVGSLWVVGG